MLFTPLPASPGSQTPPQGVSGLWGGGGGARWRGVGTLLTPLPASPGSQTPPQGVSGLWGGRWRGVGTLLTPLPASPGSQTPPQGAAVTIARSDGRCCGQRQRSCNGTRGHAIGSEVMQLGQRSCIDMRHTACELMLTRRTQNRNRSS